MSGYAFWCSKCQISHAGECPPEKKAPEPKDNDWIVTITIGSHWRCERANWVPLYNGNGLTNWMPIWSPVGPADGFEVLSIITNGVVDQSKIQVREWGQLGQPVATVPMKLWEPDGFDDGCGYIKRMVPWV